MPFDVVVAGSLNMDLVVRTSRYPAAGETLTGLDFATFLGGKGYNQALAAAKAGSQVAMIGQLGQDGFGEQFVAALAQNGLNASHVGRVANVSTGIANIIVEPNGTNRIIIVPGANGTLTPAIVEKAAEVFKECRILLLQLETPVASNLVAAQLAKAAGATVILTPAPAPAEPLPAQLIKLVDYVIPNEIEVFQLAGIAVSEPVDAAAQKLLKHGWQGVVVTLGEQGCAYYGAGQAKLAVPGFKVEVVDTTAAGDAFTGAFATNLAQGHALLESLLNANVAGALACTRLGSGTSLPTANEIATFLAAQQS